MSENRRVLFLAHTSIQGLPEVTTIPILPLVVDILVGVYLSIIVHIYEVFCLFCH